MGAVREAALAGQVQDIGERTREPVLVQQANLAQARGVQDESLVEPEEVADGRRVATACVVLPNPGGRHQLVTSERIDQRGLADARRSEEHTSELQSQSNLVCRLLLAKNKSI